MADVPHIHRLGPKGYSVRDKQMLIASAESLTPQEAVELRKQGSERSIRRWRNQQAAGESLQNKRPGPTPGLIRALCPEDLELLEAAKLAMPDMLLEVCCSLLEDAGCTDATICNVSRCHHPSRRQAPRS